MAEHVIKLPDVGEGVAEAELVEWHVKLGDLVREDAVLAAVMTDKATVEIPSPVDGKVVWLGAEVGDTVSVGSPLVRLDVAGDAPAEAAPARAAPAEAEPPKPAPTGPGRRSRNAPTPPEPRHSAARRSSGISDLPGAPGVKPTARSLGWLACSSGPRGAIDGIGDPPKVVDERLRVPDRA